MQCVPNGQLSQEDKKATSEFIKAARESVKALHPPTPN
jgi:hypothetical protein